MIHSRRFVSGLTQRNDKFKHTGEAVNAERVFCAVLLVAIVAWLALAGQPGDLEYSDVRSPQVYPRNPSEIR